MKKIPALLLVTALLSGCVTAQAQPQVPKNWLTGGLDVSLFQSQEVWGYNSQIQASYLRFLNEKQALGLSLTAQQDQTTFFNEVNSNQLITVGLNYLRLYPIHERWNWGLNYEVGHNKRATNAFISAQLWYKFHRRWMLGSELNLLRVQYNPTQELFQLGAGLNIQNFMPTLSLAFTF